MDTLRHQRPMLVNSSMDVLRSHNAVVGHGAIPSVDEPYVFSVFQASLAAGLLCHGRDQLATGTQPHRRLSDPGHRRHQQCPSPLAEDEFNKNFTSSESSMCDDIFDMNNTEHSEHLYEEDRTASLAEVKDKSDDPLPRPSTFALSRFLRPKERSTNCRGSLPTFPVSMATAYSLCRRSRASSLPKLDSLPLIETKEEDEEEDNESGLGSSADDLAGNTKKQPAQKSRPVAHTSFQLRLPDRCQRPHHRRPQAPVEEIRRRRHSDCLGLDVIAEEASVWHEQHVATPRRYSCNSDVMATVCCYDGKDRPEM